jgi:tetratricopeptide (TPR) repeat protein
MNLVTPTYLEWAAAAYHHSGNAALEERAVAEELKRFRHHPPATYGMARVYAARNDPDIEKLIRGGIPPAKDNNDVRDARGDSIELRLFAGRELRAHGHAAEAKAIFSDAATRFWPASGGQSLPLVESRRRARALYEAGDYARARDQYLLVMAADTTDLEAVGRVATASIRLGQPATAAVMEDRLKKWRRPFAMGGPLRWRAAIAAVRGRPDEAVALLELAVRQGMRLMDTPPNLTVHIDPDFVGIEQTAAYKAFLQTMADASSPR